MCVPKTHARLFLPNQKKNNRKRNPSEAPNVIQFLVRVDSSIKKESVRFLLFFLKAMILSTLFSLKKSNLFSLCFFVGFEFSQFSCKLFDLMVKFILNSVRFGATIVAYCLTILINFSLSWFGNGYINMHSVTCSKCRFHLGIFFFLNRDYVMDFNNFLLLNFVFTLWPLTPSVNCINCNIVWCCRMSLWLQSNRYVSLNWVVCWNFFFLVFGFSICRNGG